MTYLHSISFRITSLVLLAVLAIAGVGYHSYTNLRDSLFEQKKVELTNEIEVAAGVIESYRARAAAGQMSEAEAKQRAKDALRPIRFGEDKNYFFVYEADGTNVLLPAKPELEGKNLIDMKDPNGRFIVRGLLDVAKTGNGVFVYDWVKPGDKEASIKLASARTVSQWNWMVGTGFHVQDIEATLARASRTAVIATLAVILGLFVFGLFVTRSISGPLAGLTRSMERLTGGDLEAEVAGAQRRDEVGLIAGAVVTFRDLQRRRAIEEAKSENERREAAARLRREALAGLAVEFDGTVRKTAQGIEGTAGGFEAVAADLTAMSNDTRRQAEASAAAGQAAQRNVQAVSSAAEELNASISEIVSQVEHAAQLTGGAVKETSHATGVIHGLDAASAEIGKVVALIEAIAGQTNLLALNATIEAARAGEAGRGFAVVAQEVKVLAGQTSKATEEISRRIGVIQEATREAVSATGSVESSIGRVNTISTAIAGTLAQQSAAVAEIGRAISGTLQAVEGLADDMQRLMGNAASTDGKSMEVAEAARRMRGDTGLLITQVERLTRELRAG